MTNRTMIAPLISSPAVAWRISPLRMRNWLESHLSTVPRMCRIRNAVRKHWPAAAVGCSHRQPGAGDGDPGAGARPRDVFARAAVPHGPDRDFILYRGYVFGAFSVAVVAIRRLGSGTCGTLISDRRTGNSAVSAVAGNRDRRLAAGVSSSRIRRLTHAGVGEGA